MNNKEKERSQMYRVGGADVPVIFGISPYKTPLELYSIKMGLLPKPEFATEIRQQVGVELEGYVLKKYMEHEGIDVEIKDIKELKHVLESPLNDGLYMSSEKYGNIISHEKEGWMVGAVDGFLIIGDKKVIIEAKTGNSFGDWGEGDDDVPKSYLLQVHHYFNCTGCDEAHIPVLFTDTMTFKVYKIQRDEELCQLIFKKCVEFYNRLLNDDPPPAESNKDFTLLNTEKDSVMVSGDGKAEEMIQEIKKLKEQRDAIDDNIDIYEKELKNFIGEFEILQDEDGTVLATFKESETVRIDATVLKKERPDLYTQYSKTTKSRRLLLK